MIEETSKCLIEVFANLQSAKNLVDEGKEVLCSRKLQAAITKCVEMAEKVNKLKTLTKQETK